MVNRPLFQHIGLGIDNGDWWLYVTEQNGNRFRCNIGRLSSNSQRQAIGAATSKLNSRYGAGLFQESRWASMDDGYRPTMELVSAEDGNSYWTPSIG